MQTETGIEARHTITPDLLTDGTYASAGDYWRDRNHASAQLGAECRSHRPSSDPADGNERIGQLIDDWHRKHSADYTLPATLIA